MKILRNKFQFFIKLYEKFSVTVFPISTLLVMIKIPSESKKTINLKIKTKDNMYKRHIQIRRFEIDFVLLETLLTELNELHCTTEGLYYENLGKKLNNPLLQTKTYLSIRKTLYNDKKIPLIPPLLVENKFVTDMKTKANIFNKFFVEQCTPLKNNSKLQFSQMFLTQSRLISLDLNEDEILKIISALNIHEVDDHDDVSIRVIKICDKSLLNP